MAVIRTGREQVDGVISSSALPAGAATEATLAAKLGTGQGKTLLFVAIAQGAAGTTQLVAAVADSKIKVVSYVLTMAAGGSFKFTSTGDLTGAVPLAANGGAAVVGQPSSHLFESNTGVALSIVTVTGAAMGHMSYFVEA